MAAIDSSGSYPWSFNGIVEHILKVENSRKLYLVLIIRVSYSVMQREIKQLLKR